MILKPLIFNVSLYFYFLVITQITLIKPLVWYHTFSVLLIKGGGPSFLWIRPMVAGGDVALTDLNRFDLYRWCCARLLEAGHSAPVTWQAQAIPSAEAIELSTVQLSVWPGLGLRVCFKSNVAIVGFLYE